MEKAENPRLLILLSDVTANSNGAPAHWDGRDAGTLQVVGTWDTATVTIEGSLDEGVTWTAPVGSAFTADTITPFEMGAGLVRAVVSSIGASTSVSAYLSPQERN